MKFWSRYDFVLLCQPSPIYPWWRDSFADFLYHSTINGIFFSVLPFAHRGIYENNFSKQSIHWIQENRHSTSWDVALLCRCIVCATNVQPIVQWNLLQCNCCSSTFAVHAMCFFMGTSTALFVWLWHCFVSIAKALKNVYFTISLPIRGGLVKKCIILFSNSK